MFQLLETIKCKDGKLFNMEFHQVRFENAQKEYFGISPQIKLYREIEIPEFVTSGLFRCRVTYSKQIDKIEFLPHHYRKIKSLKLVEDNQIDYRFKYADREKLQNLFEARGNCDDIIIVKNGNITDSFAANVVLFDGTKWFTPDTYLLPGTQRTKLLKEGQIFERHININDLPKYEKVGLINALNNLEEMPVIDIDHIFQ
jgi:4-amino-4-deoxychorismate lyase